MARFGTALGAKYETFMGLSGVGDLLLTATGDLSRNRRVHGLLMAEGLDLDGVLKSLGRVAEGVPTAKEVRAQAERLGIEMPITRAVCRLLFRAGIAQGCDRRTDGPGATQRVRKLGRCGQ